MENFRLTVFRSVARHLNFSRAAEALLLTQPAVTKQIKGPCQGSTATGGYDKLK
jgi:DNA-binding transcriptional LysR family regulator